MTKKSFYRKLRKVANQFKWKVYRDGTLRGRRGNKTYCPITAVVKVCSNEYYAAGFYQSANFHHLNMKYYDAFNIADVADTDIEELSGKDKLSRRALLRAVFGDE